MIKELTKLATHLDNKGFLKEADYLDAIIRKMAGPPMDSESRRMAIRLANRTRNLGPYPGGPSGVAAQMATLKALIAKGFAAPVIVVAMKATFAALAATVVAEMASKGLEMTGLGPEGITVSDIADESVDLDPASVAKTVGYGLQEAGEAIQEKAQGVEDWWEGVDLNPFE